MRIVYNIYANDGRGGPVDYATPVTQTSGLEFDPGPLAAGGDYTFAVRALDLDAGVEEANTDARARILLDDAGVDVSHRPGPPHSVCVRASAGGGCRISWAHRQSLGFGVPHGFEVRVGGREGGPDGDLAATVPYVPRQVGYSCNLPGPFPFGMYRLTVRSFNAVGFDGGASSITASFGQPADPLMMGPVTARVGARPAQ